MGKRTVKSSPWEFRTASGLYDERVAEPEVVCPVARRVLRAAQQAIPTGTHRGPVFDDPEKCPFEIHEYQQWLHDRLHTSGLAKGLAGGPAFLPDVAGELQWPWNVLARMFAPRNHEQLTRKVALNLEWYLDQSRPVVDPWKAASELLWPCAYFTAITMLVLYFSTGLQELNKVVLVGVGLLMFAFLFASLMVFNRNTHKQATNTAELYSYLARSYGEPEDDQPASVVADWQQLVKGLERFSHPAD